MPIFQDDLGDVYRRSGSKSPSSIFPNSCRSEQSKNEVSEENIPRGLCEVPVHDLAQELAPRPGINPGFSDQREDLQSVGDRTKLLERLKRSEGPTWLPNLHVESLRIDHNDTSSGLGMFSDTRKLFPISSLEAIEQSRISTEPDSDATQIGLSIERPRSALHTGDFTNERRDEQEGFTQLNDLATGNIAYKSSHSHSQWLSTSPPRDFSSSRLFSSHNPASNTGSQSRGPSLSSSYSSSFVFKAPTSPLAQSESNDDQEMSSFLNPIDIEQHILKTSRRHTFQSFDPFHTRSSMLPYTERHLPHLRRDNTYPYQAHQPRRSVTFSQSISNLSTSPQTPTSQISIRPSHIYDNSPLQHASMVGSYEESILRGRMSTTPSRPLHFVAEIGVLGLGKCKSNLRCPPHVTLSFPAVFYSYGTTSYGRTGESEDGPSPYVGQIDLENGLPQSDTCSQVKHERQETVPQRENSQNTDIFEVTASERESKVARDRRKPIKNSKAPPGGSYRIPEKGQIQVIIKNQNKTAVKLFLVPYDLAGMGPGTKTFIRQRLYSAGPIIDSPLSSSSQSQLVDTSKERPILRYLIHLHICSPSRGRFYLYKSIRVVFANRVPDGKEKLKNEIQLPEPRFSVYKPARESNIGIGVTPESPLGLLAIEKSLRRKSAGFPAVPLHSTINQMDSSDNSFQRKLSNVTQYSHINKLSPQTAEPLPYTLFPQRMNSIDCEQSLALSKTNRPPTSQESETSGSWSSSSASIGAYDKLRKGDVGYGGNAFTTTQNGLQSASEGLLALKLKSLGIGNLEQNFPGDGI